MSSHHTSNPTAMPILFCSDQPNHHGSTARHIQAQHAGTSLEHCEYSAPDNIGRAKTCGPDVPSGCQPLSMVKHALLRIPCQGLLSPPSCLRFSRTIRPSPAYRCATCTLLLSRISTGARGPYQTPSAAVLDPLHSHHHHYILLHSSLHHNLVA